MRNTATVFLIFFWSWKKSIVELVLSDAGEEEEDEEEPNEEEYDDQYEFGNQQGGAQNEEYEDEEQEYPYEQEAEQDENISRKQQSEKFYERRIATETDKPRANHFSIEEHAEDDSRRQYQTKSNILLCVL